MPTIKIYNTFDNSEIEREMTEQELSDWHKSQEESTKLQKKLAEAAAAKATILEKLGITEDEAKLLLS